MLGVTSAATLGNANETQSLGFTDSRGDRCAVHAVFDKIVCGYWQTSVVISAVVAQLDFDARYRLMP
jgi:hypothetical protein